jgi:Reverse transcriptase (RNA-dependent DNA polymerase)
VAKAPAPYSAQLYLLDDHARTLFPLTTTRVVVSNALTEIQQHIQEILNPKTSDAFLVQQRCYASKTGHHLRRTAALDPVATYFIYELLYNHRAKLTVKPSATRKSFGYRFQLGKPLAPSISYGQFRAAIRDAHPKYKHAVAFDISSFFNSVYHHDLTEWFEASIAMGPHEHLGQFLRQCNRGRSIDCLPHGFHPCKAIGSAFLYDIDNSVELESALMLRFLDDFYLFDNDEHVLVGDFMKIQRLLGERSLTVNTHKTQRDDDVLRLAPGTIDEIKVELLELRRAIVVDQYGETSIEEVDEEEDDDPLTDEQLEYLLDLLKNPDIDESDAELVLTVLKSRDEDVLEHLGDILERFPSLTRRIYTFSKHVTDLTELCNLLDKFVNTARTATEDQLFWIAKIAEDYLLGTAGYSKLLLRVYQHSAATPIVQAKVLEIKELKSGFQDIREGHFKGSSDWRAWASIVGSTLIPKGKRNQMLNYVGKASQMNGIVAAAVQ